MGSIFLPMRKAQSYLFFFVCLVFAGWCFDERETITNSIIVAFETFAGTTSSTLLGRGGGANARWKARRVPNGNQSGQNSSFIDHQKT